ncbi:hypothetical protein M8998_06355 [Sphingobacterium sp. lm-10]|uniref:hypothetical protein n=1 Tax=Sphingobacterium sp. lm-10 TaxID=2944904 RepID=UPI0020200E3A|nr:hypothetical protein [Sphingobacterium sp. lm-10]MCL7987555.1 hypothetical protein [Sphingobacterium sp. lm-10]
MSRIHWRLCLILSLIGFSVSLMHAQVHPDSIRQTLGKVRHPALQELSGMVPSVANPHCFWVHNDSGDEANIYLIDSVANLLCTYGLEGVSARDFEEIAWVVKDGKYHLVVGDIGDNRGKRKQVVFHLFPEPVWQKGDLKEQITQVSSFSAVYPDGPRDAEAFFVDPLTNQLILISKRDFHVHVYSANFLQDAHYAGSNKPYLLKKEAELPLFFVTAADISPNGQDILIRNLTNIYHWRRDPSQSVISALQKAYTEIPYAPEPQGEAIAFDRNSRSFYTISERPLGLDSYLYQYQLIN